MYLKNFIASWNFFVLFNLIDFKMVCADVWDRLENLFIMTH